MNNLKNLRKSKNLRQQDIADYLSVAKSTYSYWETGKIEMCYDVLFRLADFYDVTIDYLIDRDPATTDTNQNNNDAARHNAIIRQAFIDSGFLTPNDILTDEKVEQVADLIRAAYALDKRNKD